MIPADKVKLGMKVWIVSPPHSPAIATVEGITRSSNRSGDRHVVDLNISGVTSLQDIYLTEREAWKPVLQHHQYEIKDLQRRLDEKRESFRLAQKKMRSCA